MKDNESFQDPELSVRKLSTVHRIQMTLSWNVISLVANSLGFEEIKLLVKFTSN